MKQFWQNHLFTLLLLGLTYSGATAQETYPRFELELGGGLSCLPNSDPNGWFARQQLTAYLKPRIGISAAIGWAGSANTSPLTLAPNAYGLPDPARLDQFYVRMDRMLDLSAVLLPVLTRHHQVSVRVGISAYRSQTTRVDSVIYYNQSGPLYYQTRLNQPVIRQIAPLVGIGYDYRLSNRWSLGIQTTAYLNAPGRQTAWTTGLRTSYQFGLSPEALGFAAIEKEGFRTGLRVAAGVVSTNQRSVAGIYGRGATAGLWAELPLSLTWQFRGELDYAQRNNGTRAMQVGNFRYPPGTTRLGYLEIPLLFRNEVAYCWHLYSGPYVATLLHANSEIDGIAQPVDPHTVVGLMAGADYQLSNRVALDLRYQRDLVQLSRTPHGGLHSFQLGVNWSFQRSNP
ncbi:hypothetical protein GCM10027578_33230 [Spirosoma luteolum]